MWEPPKSHASSKRLKTFPRSPGPRPSWPRSTPTTRAPPQCCPRPSASPKKGQIQKKSKQLLVQSPPTKETRDCNERWKKQENSPGRWSSIRRSAFSSPPSPHSAGRQTIHTGTCRSRESEPNVSMIRWHANKYTGPSWHERLNARNEWMNHYLWEWLHSNFGKHFD